MQAWRAHYRPRNASFPISRVTGALICVGQGVPAPSVPEKSVTRLAGKSMNEQATAGLLVPDKTHEEGSPDGELTTAKVEATLKSIFEGEANPPPGQEPQPGADQPGAEGLTEEHAESESEEAKAQWPESAQRRVDKLTGQRAELRGKLTESQRAKEAAETRAAELEAKLAAEPKAPVVPTAAEPLGFIETPQALGEFVSMVKTRMRDIEDYLDDALVPEHQEAFQNWAKANGAYDGDTFDNAKLKQLRRLAQDTLTEHAPRRMNFFTQEAPASAMAEEKFPWLKDKNSAEYKTFQDVVKTMPEMRRLPQWKAFIGIFVTGLKAVQAAEGSRGNGGSRAATTGKPTAATARLPGAGTSVPQRTSPGEGADAINTLRKKAYDTNNPQDWQAFIKAQVEAA